MTVSPRQWEVYDQRRAAGWPIGAAAKQAGVGYSTAKHRETRKGGERDERKALRLELEAGAPVPLDRLSDDARRATEDFGYFQRRYLGRLATPWQEEAAYTIVDLLQTDQKEFVVLNAPPGTGKSTTFTHDIPIWLTIRNRAIRGLIGSRTQSQADTYTTRMRRTLERTSPYKADAGKLEVDAEATLIDDFGRFKPQIREQWANSGFVVAQLGDHSIVEKEPTWSSYGFDSGFLGMRFDIVIWDDLADPVNTRTAESRETLQVKWDDMAETRLEPAGLLVLQGQRIGPDDIYRYNLNKIVVPDEDEDEDPDEQPRMYRHIVYKAHYEDRCHGDHKPKTAAYYPDGCLLDPKRLTWRELRGKMANPRNNFATLYQQEDSDPSELLVNPLWVNGGEDPKTGELFPGCRDQDRDIWEFPRGLAGDWLVMASVDPSPTKYWSIQLWATRCENGVAYERYLIDHYRGKLDIPGFLDQARHSSGWIGLAEEWQTRSEQMGFPITHWIVETNAAQKFMLQHQYTRDWAAHHRVTWVSHTTSLNKLDPDYGVQSVAGVWRAGLIRLPWKTNRIGPSGFLASAKLVEEVTHHPQWSTEDCVMAHWFNEAHIPALMPSGAPLPKFKRPGWLQKADTYRRTG